MFSDAPLTNKHTQVCLLFVFLTNFEDFVELWRPVCKRDKLLLYLRECNVVNKIEKKEKKRKRCIFRLESIFSWAQKGNEIRKRA